MKKILAAAMMALGALAATAADTHTLVIESVDGTKAEYAFESIPVATFDGDEMTITTGGGIDRVLYPMADVVSMTIDTQSAVKSVAGTSLRVAFAGMLLTAEGLADGAELRVYGMDGRLELTAVSYDGRAVADLSQLPQGVHAVTAGNKSFKIVK